MAAAAYRRDIDGLRTLAVVPVVLFHAGFAGFSGGFIGVDIFFVISGFLITGILQRELDQGRFSLVRFYERRARRILPALLAMIAVTFLVGAFISLPEQFLNLGYSAAAAAGFAANIWFWLATGNYFAPGVETEPLLHTWSLAVEEQFYIFFPLVLWLLARRAAGLRLAVVVTLCLASLVLAQVALRYDPQGSFYLLPTRAWELGIGALLALGLFPSRSPKVVTEVAAAGGLALIVWCVITYSNSTRFPGVNAIAPCVGAGLLIWAGGVRTTLAGRLLGLRPMVGIGLVSYSLYLWHWPILAFLRQIHGTNELPLWAGGLAVLAAGAMAWLSWAFVEQPFRRPPPHGFSQRTIFLSSAAGLSAVMALALVIWSADGFEKRFSPQLLAFLSGKTDTNPDRDVCFNRHPSQGLCYFEGTAPAEPDDTAEADVLLWGDSHVAAMMVGVRRALDMEGLSGRVATKEACAPFLGLTRGDRGAGHDCAGFNADVLAFLDSREDMGLVILGGRWPLALEEVSLKGEGSRVASWVATDPGANAPSQAERVSMSLSRTVDAIRATGREVLILGGVPEVGWLVPEGLVRRATFGDFGPALPMTEDVKARQASSNALLSKLASQDGVSVLPLIPHFCETETCHVSQDGRALYFDDDHLSRFGAETILAPLLTEVLEQRP